MRCLPSRASARGDGAAGGRADRERPVQGPVRRSRAARPEVLNKRLVESLVKAGAFDSLNRTAPRSSGHRGAGPPSQATQESRVSTRKPVRRRYCPAPPAVAQGAGLAPMERLQNEFAAIGFISRLIPWRPTSAAAAPGRHAGRRPAGLLQRGAPGRISLPAPSSIARNALRQRHRFAFVQCSDQSGAFELTVFSELLAQAQSAGTGTGGAGHADGRLDGEQ